MKALPTILAALTALTTAHATAISILSLVFAWPAQATVITDMRSTEGVTVTWAQDSSDGFNLSLSGTGIPFDRIENVILGDGTPASLSYYEWHPLGDAFRSNSGQWIIQPSLTVQVSRNIAGQFTGLDYQIFGNVWNTGFADGFLLYDPSNPGFVRPHYFELMTEKYQSGDTFTSWAVAMATDLYGEQLDNPATWSWAMNIISHAPPQQMPETKHVPDYTSSGLCLAFASGLLLLFRGRK